MLSRDKNKLYSSKNSIAIVGIGPLSKIYN